MLGDPDHVQLHRVLRATPERIYRAFVVPEAMVKWLPPGIAGAAGKTWGGGDSGLSANGANRMIKQIKAKEHR